MARRPRAPAPRAPGTARTERCPGAAAARARQRTIGRRAIDAGEAPVAAQEAVRDQRDRDRDRRAQRRPDLEVRAREHAPVAELLAEGGQRQRVAGRDRARRDRDQHGVDRDRRRDRRQQRDRAAPGALLGRQVVVGSRRARLGDLRRHRVQLAAERGRAGRSLRRIDRHRARDQRRSAAAPRARRRPRCARAVGVAAGDHVRQQRAHRVDVHARIGRGAGARLGRHVAGRAQHQRRAGERTVARRRLEQPRDAEVGQLGAAVVAHEHVLGLDVAVDDAARVRVGERVAELARDHHRLAGRQRQPLGERAARHQLHHDVALAGRRGAEVVDADDAGVLEPRQRARLAREASAEVGIGRALGPQHLDRDVAAEAIVVRAEDAAHAARAQLRPADAATSAPDVGSFARRRRRVVVLACRASRQRGHTDNRPPASGAPQRGQALMRPARARDRRARPRLSSGVCTVSAMRASRSSRKRPRARCTNDFSCGTVMPCAAASSS